MCSMEDASVASLSLLSDRDYMTTAPEPVVMGGAKRLFGDHGQTGNLGLARPPIPTKMTSEENEWKVYLGKRRNTRTYNQDRLPNRAECT